MQILPKKPIVVLDPAQSMTTFSIRDFWQYRELLYILAARDIRVRYKQTVLGAAWAIVQPLSAMIIFNFLFGSYVSAGDTLPYPLFAYSGLLPWVFFSNAVTNSGNSLVSNSGLITKVYFPRIIIPVAAVVSGLVDFLVAFVILLVLMIYYGVSFSPSLLLLPMLVLIIAGLATGVGMWMAALNVKYRDVGHALPFLIQIFMFASGIIAPIPEKYRFLMYLNPIAAQIEAFRGAVSGAPMPLLPILSSLILTAAILFYSVYLFRKAEDDFADLV
jgi:lipopolysaccharide transport system permease protein